MKTKAALLLLLMGWFSYAHANLAVDTENLHLGFSDWGDLVEARACLPDCLASNARIQEYNAYRGLLSINRDSEFAYELERIDGDHSVTLIFKNLISNEVRQWVIPHSGWLLSLAISRPQALSLTSGDAFVSPAMPGFGGWLETLRYTLIEQGGPRQYGLDEELGPLAFKAGWLGYRNRYWAAMIKTDAAVIAKLHGGEGQVEAQLDLSPDGSEPSRFLLYVGPLEPAALEAAAPELTNLMYASLWFWLRWICQLFYMTLAAIQSVIPGWGVAIILMSLLVQVMMRPLNGFAERLQRQVGATEARIHPQILSIKKNHKGAVQAEKILELYQREGVHPLYSLKSLAGLVVVVPVFIGAFNMLAENIWLSGQSFLWISDLSRPDALVALPISIPFLGQSLNLLPFIMTALNIPVALTQAGGTQTRELKARHFRRSCGMALLFFVLFYTFPAAMVLYWTINNLFALLMVTGRKLRSPTVAGETG